MSELNRAAAYLEQYAEGLEEGHTIKGLWDDAEAKAEHDELLELAAALRAELEREVEPVAAPAGYFCEPYLNKPGLFEQVFNGFDDPDVIPLYRDPNGRIAALEREVEALALRTEKAIDAIAASRQGILDNCRAGQPVDSGERATIGRPCPNLRGGREMNNRDCEHGQLGRTCPLCELEEELAEKAKTIAALEREVEALRSLLSDVTCVAITMLYESHKQDVLDVFTLDELKEVVRRSEHLQIAKVEHIYRRGFEALAAGEAG